MHMRIATEVSRLEESPCRLDACRSDSLLPWQPATPCRTVSYASPMRTGPRTNRRATTRASRGPTTSACTSRRRSRPGVSASATPARPATSPSPDTPPPSSGPASCGASSCAARCGRGGLCGVCGLLQADGCGLAFEGVDLFTADEGRAFGAFDVGGDPDGAVDLPFGVPLLPPVAAHDPGVVVLTGAGPGLAGPLRAAQLDDAYRLVLLVRPAQALPGRAVRLHLGDLRERLSHQQPHSFEHVHAEPVARRLLTCDRDALQVAVREGRHRLG